MKLIVAGSRDYTNVELIYHILDIWKSEIIEIVSGTAKGADTIASTWAIKNNISLKEFPADWKKHGRSAGPIRNGEMAEYADTLFAFRENESKGTSNMINQMKNINKPHIVWDNSNNITVEKFIDSGHDVRVFDHLSIIQKFFM